MYASVLLLVLVSLMLFTSEYPSFIYFSTIPFPVQCKLFSPFFIVCLFFSLVLIISSCPTFFHSFGGGLYFFILKTQIKLFFCFVLFVFLANSLSTSIRYFSRFFKRPVNEWNGLREFDFKTLFRTNLINEISVAPGFRTA